MVITSTCIQAMHYVKTIYKKYSRLQSLENVCYYHILEDVCNVDTSTRSLLQNTDSSSDKYPDIPLHSAKLEGQGLCRGNTYPYASLWADKDDVGKALHIRENVYNDFGGYRMIILYCK